MRFLLLISFLMMSNAPAAAWTYANETYGYSVEIPDELGRTYQPLHGNAGIALQIRDHQAQVHVSAYALDDAHSSHAFAELLRAGENFGTVGYEIINEQWLVLSGTREDGEMIYYLRAAFAPDRSAVAIMEFVNHRTKAGLFADEIRIMSGSLTPPKPRAK